MEVIATGHPEVLLLKPAVHCDARGFFFESYQKRQFEALGIAQEFVQDNHSHSTRGVLRGLHYQVRQPQGKLVRVIAGRVFDVAVDLRRASPYFGRAVGFTLDAATPMLAWIPPGFAHGFLALSDSVDYLYKTTDYYAPGFDRSLLWNDPELAIPWPLDTPPVVSAKDQAGLPLAVCECYD